MVHIWREGNRVGHLFALHAQNVEDEPPFIGEAMSTYRSSRYIFKSFIFLSKKKKFPKNYSVKKKNGGAPLIIASSIIRLRHQLIFWYRRRSNSRFLI